MTDPTREEALEHFGVRGMHWGVRNKSSSDMDIQEYDGGGSGRKVGKKILIGTLVTAGAIAAGVILAKQGGVSTAGLHTKIAKGAEASKQNNAKIKKGAQSVGRMAKAFRESGRANKGYVPEATRLFKGQKYASYTMQTYGNLPVLRMTG